MPIVASLERTEAARPTPRPVRDLISAQRVMEGEGFEVRRAIPSAGVEAVGPFIFLDHLGPVEFAPGQAKGAPNHPHRGFETLTYLIEGRGEHRDSLGNVGVIGPGEAQWMRAGSGILHDEGADAVIRRDGGRLHGLQLWINLPQGRKMSPPAYRQIGRAEIPEVARGGATLRLVAGALEGLAGPVETFAAPFMAHVAFEPGGRIAFEPPAGEVGVYVATGAVRVGATVVEEGQLARLSEGERLDLAADVASHAFVLGGPPLDAPIRRYGPFVMNTDAELVEAVRDFQAGRFGTIPDRVAAPPLPTP